MAFVQQAHKGGKSAYEFMIEYITGQLKQKSPATAVVEINGIAYKLFIPASTYDKLPECGNVTLFTDLVISGGMQSANELKLFGFFAQEERQLFQMLCSVTRIGPLLALRILSGAAVNQIKQAIVSEDLSFLGRIKGVGEKTAQRIVMELKDSIKSFTALEPSMRQTNNVAVTEAILVLGALGYQRGFAENAVRQALTKSPLEITTETLVRLALKGN